MADDQKKDYGRSIGAAGLLFEQEHDGKRWLSGRFGNALIEAHRNGTDDNGNAALRLFVGAPRGKDEKGPAAVAVPAGRVSARTSKAGKSFYSGTFLGLNIAVFKLDKPTKTGGAMFSMRISEPPRRDAEDKPQRQTERRADHQAPLDAEIPF